MSKQYSYADEARKLVKKYSRAKFDKIEKAELEAELQKLQELQEVDRQAMGLDNTQKQFALGGENSQSVPMDYVERFQQPWNFLNPDNSQIVNNSQNIPTASNNTIPQINNNMLPQVNTTINSRGTNNNMLPMQNLQGIVSGYGNRYMGATTGGGFASEVTQKPFQLPTQQLNTSLETGKLNSFAAQKRDQAEQMQDQEDSDLTASYVSAGASMLGNIGQSLLDKKPRQIISPTYTPEQLNLSEERLMAEQQATESGNIARRNLREGALSTGQAMANMGALEAGIQGTKGDVLTKLGTAEKQYNVGAKNEANRINTQTKAQDLLTNQQLSDAWKQRQLAYLSGTVGVVPQAMQDINRIKQQYKYLSQLSQADRNRLKALNSWYPNYMLGQGNLPTFKK